jgi:methylenetetrahydrofolate dehydrogenase (NADP+)/methenyltetrahydrofolate cyclohydrolase
MKLDGTDIAKRLYGELQRRVDKLKLKNITPHLVVILVGEHPASVAYVTLKQKKGEEIGAKVTILNYATDVTTTELVEKIKLLNDDPFVQGILVQRPLPGQIDIEQIEMATNPEKDVDGFHPNSPFTLPLPLAVVRMLEEVHYSEKAKQSFREWLQAQKIVLLGKGPTGGGPIIAYLKKLDVTPQLVDSKTKSPEKILKRADIIISAVGRQHTIKPNNLKQGVVLISVGINRGENKKLHGDYEVEEIKDIASYYTPTPGGVGPVNVAVLMENLLTATERQTKNA